MDELDGFPYWQVDFDAEGNVIWSGEVIRLTAELPDAQLTDLFVISHGWNTTPVNAKAMYQKFFREVRSLLDSGHYSWQKSRSMGVIGVTWPSILWPDDDSNAEALVSPAASVQPLTSIDSQEEEQELIRALKSAFADGRQRQIVEDIGTLLVRSSTDNERWTRFWELTSELVRTTEHASTSEDDEEFLPVPSNPIAMLNELGSTIPGDSSPAASILGVDQKLRAAKDVLRLATFRCMKNRAGHVGAQGLAPLLTSLFEQLASDSPHVDVPRIHLIGHSFGARLVSYALNELRQLESPTVGSVVLLQAAFSQYSFAPQLPHAPKRSGALKGIQERVAGPVIVTFSPFDRALGDAYSIGAMLVGQDAQSFDMIRRWGSLGYFGAKATPVDNQWILDAGTQYQFTPKAIVNLDCERVIRETPKCKRAAGAHNDIFYPAIAWMTLAAAGLTG